jgi:hypothetical protein
MASWPCFKEGRCLLCGAKVTSRRFEREWQKSNWRYWEATLVITLQRVVAREKNGI